MTMHIPARARVPSVCALGFALWLIASPGEAACLMKPMTTNAGMTIYAYMIAPQSEVAGYVALGFGRVACPSDLSSYRDYVDRLCATAPPRGESALDTIVLFGRSREEACASARAGLLEAGS